MLSQQLLEKIAELRKKIDEKKDSKKDIIALALAIKDFKRTHSIELTAGAVEAGLNLAAMAANEIGTKLITKYVVSERTLNDGQRELMKKAVEKYEDSAREYRKLEVEYKQERSKSRWWRQVSYVLGVVAIAAGSFGVWNYHKSTKLEREKTVLEVRVSNAEKTIKGMADEYDKLMDERKNDPQYKAQVASMTAQVESLTKRVEKRVEEAEKLKAEPIRSKPIYIRGPTGTLEVSSSSDKYLNVPQALDFAEKQGGRLQTIAEALVTRIAFYEADKKDESGLDESNDHQTTSTISLTLRNDGSFNVDAPYVTAFVDLPVDERSRRLVQAGYDANHKNKQLILPVKDSFICDLIARAKDTGRIAPAQTTRTLPLKLEKEKGKSEYGQHQTPVAIFGNAELAELNATYLKGRGYDFGQVWDLTQKELEKMLKEGQTLVRAVGLGGDGIYNGVYYVDADGNFGNGGRARSVVHGAQKETVTQTANTLEKLSESIERIGRPDLDLSYLLTKDIIKFDNATEARIRESQKYTAEIFGDGFAKSVPRMKYDSLMSRVRDNLTKEKWETPEAQREIKEAYAELKAELPADQMEKVDYQIEDLRRTFLKKEEKGDGLNEWKDDGLNEWKDGLDKMEDGLNKIEEKEESINKNEDLGKKMELLESSRYRTRINNLWTKLLYEEPREKGAPPPEGNFIEGVYMDENQVVDSIKTYLTRTKGEEYGRFGLMFKVGKFDINALGLIKGFFGGVKTDFDAEINIKESIDILGLDLTFRLLEEAEADLEYFSAGDNERLNARTELIPTDIAVRLLKERKVRKRDGTLIKNFYEANSEELNPATFSLIEGKEFVMQVYRKKSE